MYIILRYDKLLFFPLPNSGRGNAYPKNKVNVYYIYEERRK